MNAMIEQRYEHYFGLTNDAAAAATLTLAEVNCKACGAPATDNHKCDLTVKQAARIMQVSPDTVRDWIHSGALKASNVGSGIQKARYRIAAADLEAFRASRRPEPPVSRRKPRKHVPSYKRDFAEIPRPNVIDTAA